MTWREIVRGLGDLVFPPSCVHCGRLVEESGFRHLCARCGRRLAFVREPLDAPGFDAGWAAVRLGGPARSLILALKYRGARYLAEDAEEIFRRSPVLLGHARGAVLVPVPLHPRKERERGYNQSEVLAWALARAAGGARVVRLLRRVVDTPSQTGFDRRRRAENVKNAFALNRRAGFDPHLRILLVDDVFTTGSTLHGCARVLRGAGCLKLDATAFGHG